MKNHPVLLSFLAFLFLTACNAEKPTIQGGEKLPAPKFTSDSYKISSFVAKTFSGTCDKEIVALEISQDQESWTDLMTVDPNALVNCKSNGTFSFQLNLSDPEYSSLKTELENGEVVEGWIRGKSEFMMSDNGMMTIRFATANGNPIVRALQNPTSVSSGGYKLKASLVAVDKTSTSQSTNYKLHGAVVRGVQ